MDKLPLLKEELACSEPVILFLFSPYDCGTCLTILNRLDVLSQIYKSIRFLGVLSEADIDIYKKLKTQYDLHFQLLLDENGYLKTHYMQQTEYKCKPMLFLINQKIISIKGIVGKPQDEKKIKEIFEWINNYTE
ncbi:MAG: hypothetical protein R6V04_09990 [bacterium]